MKLWTKFKNWLRFFKRSPKPDGKYLQDACAITIFTSDGRPMQNINFKKIGAQVSWASSTRLVIVLNCTQQDVDYHM
jgi:hypothetical protein